MLHTTSSASIELGIPVTTLLAWEARGAVGPWERDRAGRRVLTEEDLTQVRAYAQERRRAQGRELEPVPRSGDPGDTEPA